MPFEPKGLGAKIFSDRHAIHETETWVEGCARVANHVAAAESGEAINHWREEFNNILVENLFHPGGRIWYGSGRAKGQLLNCFVIGSDNMDSREGWGKTVSDMIVISGTGGGVGINCSPVRPRGSKIQSAGGTATGAISLMEIVNAAGDVIKAGGGRRVALMLCLNYNHGDILEFLDKKLDLKQLNNANVSVFFQDNPEEFFDKVRNDTDLELKFNGRVVGVVKAKELWHKIVVNALKSGEPGLLNGWLANKQSNIWYHAPITSTNPCQPGWAKVLTPEGVKTFNDIGKGSRIWSGKQWTTVVQKVHTGFKPVYEYVTNHGTFFGTQEHRVVENGVKVEVKNAKSIDLAFFPPQPVWPPAEKTAKISQVKFCGFYDVYDITVDAAEHTYWSDGLLVSNCGEIPLENKGVCCLGALVLPRFATSSGFDAVKLKNTIQTAVRFLDNVLTVNNYPLSEIAEEANAVRRIGLGYMGLHDYLLMRGLKYNSPEGLEEANRVAKFIKTCAYEASIDLAIERGPFPVFEADKYLKSGFAKSLRPKTRARIAKHGIRNCALLTIAPTGTTSMVAGVTSGIEPMFAPAYARRWWAGDKREVEIVVHPLFMEFVLSGKDVSHFQGTYDLSMRDHFEMQRTCQQHIDNAVSKTINVPQGVSTEELAELYMEYFPELKGVTVYPDGSRENQPLQPLSLEQALAAVGSSEVGSSGVDNCKDGKCDV